MEHTTASPRLVRSRRSGAIARMLAIAAGLVAIATVTVPMAPSAAEAVPAEAAEAAGSEAAGSAVPDASATAAASVPLDAGVTVPAGQNEVTADVLGRGYEQVIRLNENEVEIVEPETRGGEVIRSFDARAAADWPRQGLGAVYYGGSNILEQLPGRSASRLAVAGRSIYVSNLRTRLEKDIDGKTYVRADGSVTTRYNVDGTVLNQRTEGREFAVTALDGFLWHGEEYLAIGLNYTGVKIVKGATGTADDPKGMLMVQQLLQHWTGPHRPGGEAQARDQITEVELGVDGDDRLIVVIGALTREMPAIVAHEAISGRELWTKNFRPHDHGWEWPEVIAFGELGADRRHVIGVGWPTLGRLTVMDPTTGADLGVLDGGRVSAMRFFTDASGEAALGFRRGQYPDVSSHVAKLNTAGTPAIVATSDGGALEWMVPGYRPWLMQVENRSRAEISFKGFAGANRANGCWLVGGLHGVSNRLPTSPVRIGPGANAGPFVSARRTTGDGCGSSEPGVFYAQVELPGEPGHRRLVQLHGRWDGVRILEQVGSGRLAVHVEPYEEMRDGLYGVRLVVTDRYAAPTIEGAPVLDASRLTPAPAAGYQPKAGADDPTRPVHRFTVSGLSWWVPGADADLSEAVLPLPFAEGSVDGVEWDRLGTVASPVAPTRVGERITMGRAVFDWQTVAGAAKNHRFFRVVAGGAASNVVDVTGLAAPEPAVVSGVSIVEGSAPRPNGLDQSPMRVSLIDGDLREMDPGAYPASYDRIYYRDALSNALITGLGDPADPSQLVMFSLSPGQYANEAVSATSNTSIGVYFSTRSNQPGRKVKAMFKHNAIGPAALEGSAPLAPAGAMLAPNGGSTGADGISISSCLEGACALADASAAPAMHSLTSTSVTVQLRAVAVPGGASLPLIEPEKYTEELTIASDGFQFLGSRASLRNPNGFGYNATISGQLVTHGERVALENLYVRSREVMP